MMLAEGGHIAVHISFYRTFPATFPVLQPTHLEACSFSCLHLGCWLCRQCCGCGIALDVVGIPSHVALEAVFNVGWRSETMILAGIDDEFRSAAEPLQCLVELLGVDDGDVPINFTTHDQSWCGDVGNLVERREFLIRRAMFPR